MVLHDARRDVHHPTLAARVLRYLFTALVFVVAVMSPSQAHAQVPSPDGALAQHANACTPGSRAACTCPDGRRGSRTCQWPGVSFSVCVCGAANLPSLPKLPSLSGRKRKKVKRRISGIGLLIAGSIVGFVGAGNLFLGIERVVHDEDHPLFIFMIVHGGVCGLVGVPMALVGTALFAQRGPRRRWGSFELEDWSTLRF